MITEPKRVVHVLLPNGTREEAAQARQALESDDVILIMGTASAHTAGQKLNGDVVVIGSPPATIDEDAIGKVTKFTSMSAMRKSSAHEPEPEKSMPLGSEPAPATVDASTAPEPEPEPEEEHGALEPGVNCPEDTRGGPPSDALYSGDDDGEALTEDSDAVDTEMHEIAMMCGVELPEGKVTNDGLRDIAESLGIELSVAYVKNADLVAMIRRETQG